MIAAAASTYTRTNSVVILLTFVGACSAWLVYDYRKNGRRP